MKLNDFDKLIKSRNLSGAYYLYGPEEYSKIKMVQRVIDCTAEATRDLNVQVYKPPFPDWSEIESACSAFPFFDDFRVVVVRDIDSNAEDNIARFAGRIPETTVLLLVRPGPVPKKSPLMDLLRNPDHTVEFQQYQEEGALAFVRKRAAENRITLSPGTDSYLVQYCGCDLPLLENSLLKLSAFAESGQPVTREMVDQCITPVTEYAFYLVGESLFKGNISDAIEKLYNEIRCKRETYTGFLFYLLRRIKTLIVIKQMLLDGRSQQEIAAKAGVSPSSLKYTVRTLQRFSLERLCSMEEAFSEAHENIIKGVSNDENALIISIYKAFAEVPK